MGIYLGNTQISNIYMSYSRIKSAYRGDSLVFWLENGIYIQDTNGLLYTKEKWSKSSKTANAIAVITDECRFLISLKYNTAGGNVDSWSPNGETDLLSGVATMESTQTACKDYRGYENTEYILGYYGVTSRAAANRCKNFTFPNGQKGYLASAGEWDIAYSNKSKIDEYLSLVSAEAIITSDRHWTSTQRSNESAYIFRWTTGGMSSVGKQYGFPVRPFGQLSDNVTFA